MNITVCKIFLNIVKYQSMSKAAESLYLSQSAVSQQIRTLENRLGVSLFERTHNGVTLSDYGVIVQPYIERIVDNHMQMLNTLNLQKHPQKVLKIASTPVVYSYALPCTIYHIKQHFPRYELEIETMASAIIEEEILKGTNDIGFIVGEPKNKKLYYKNILTDNVVLIASQEMKIPSRIHCRDLIKYPLILPSHSCKSRDVIETHLSNIDVDFHQLHILYELDSTESMKMSVMQGYGLAFMPYMGVKKELYTKQLKIITLDDYRLNNHYYMIRTKNKHHQDTDFMQVSAYLESMFNKTVC